ncbi:MAG: 2-deoxy-5-keto-D-gluconate 6-phosphate aldolase domain-containing protein [Acetobacteraceae bacterium]
MQIGYDQLLYILPFDHRSSFSKGLFGWSGPLQPQQVERIADTKQVIYEAFKQAVQKEGGDRRSAILVDEQFGAAILRGARSSGIATCMPVEKSGQEEFEFEYGTDFAAHIEAFKPDFVKVLVRYNPDGEAALNRRQAERLKRLSDYVHAHDHRLLFELLVPMTHEQSDRLEGEQRLYDKDLRPSLMLGAIEELQEAGVEPDVWKLEGLDRREDCQRMVEAARSGGRDKVSCIILGRGSDAEQVVAWLRTAAPVPGFIGFAVGRTTFWGPLVALKEGKTTRDQAASAIAERYLEWARVFDTAREKVAAGS